MIIDQLFEEDKKKKFNEIDSHNFAGGEEEQLDELSWKDIQRGAKKVSKGAQKFTKNVADTGAAIGGAARDVGGAIKQVGKTAKAVPGTAQRQAYAGTNPKTGKPYTVDELLAYGQTPTPAAATGQPAKTPNVAGPTGYGKTTYSVKPMTGIPGIKAPAASTAPAAPKAPAVKYSVNLPAGGGAGIKAANLNAPVAKLAKAIKRPVAEMLDRVETKEDVARIKQFIDQTFVKYGAVSESAFAARNRLIEHVTQVGAQRRRRHSQRVAQ